MLYVAMAGIHQLWAMPLGRGTMAPHTGDGREALEDGPLAEASMNQPSGLAGVDGRLYVADSEASAIRVVDLADGTLRTIVGEGSSSSATRMVSGRPACDSSTLSASPGP